MFVLENESDSLASYEQGQSALFNNPVWREFYSKVTPLVDSGHREILQVIDVGTTDRPHSTRNNPNDGERTMADLDKAVATQLANIQKRTGKSIEELTALVRSSGLAKHGERVAMLKSTLGMGHGDANMIVHMALRPEHSTADNGSTSDDVLDVLYVGPKAALRPIHDRLLDVLRSLGEFSEAPKKTYVSYRRSRQFAMIGPATNSRVEVGLNVKGLESHDRLKELPPGGMCNYAIRLASASDVDADLISWISSAYEAAG